TSQPVRAGGQPVSVRLGACRSGQSQSRHATAAASKGRPLRRSLPLRHQFCSVLIISRAESAVTETHQLSVSRFASFHGIVQFFGYFLNTLELLFLIVGNQV